jgi:hypothetical protein
VCRVRALLLLLELLLLLSSSRLRAFAGEDGRVVLYSREDYYEIYTRVDYNTQYDAPRIGDGDGDGGTRRTLTETDAYAAAARATSSSNASM